MSQPFVIPSVFTAIDKFSAPMRNMGNAVTAFVARSERQLMRANTAFTNLLSPITNLNRVLMGLGLYVGLFTLIRIVKNAIDIFANFEQANADLAVVMGTTVQKNKILADEARRIGLAYGESATEVVRMQHALATLGFEQDQIMQMGRPLITGSAALEGADPERLAGTVGAVVNAFNLGAGDTQHILDVMALSANRTALNFEKLATTLPIVSGPARTVNISFEETVALLGVLANAGVHVATSATSLKNIFIDSAKKGHTYTEVLANIAEHSNQLVFANKMFGKRSVVSALALEKKMHDARNGVIALTAEFKNAELGLTNLIALQRLDTFRGAQKLLKAAYHEFILSLEDGNGPTAEALTRMLRIVSAMLLVSSTSDQAREAVSKISPDILDAANKWLRWTKVIGVTIAALIAIRIALWAWRGALLIVTAVQGLFSIAMGVSAAMGWRNVWALRGNVIALTTLRIITGLATAAQWLFNAAMNANPIVLVATAVLGLVLAYNKLTDATSKYNKEQKKNPVFDIEHEAARFSRIFKALSPQDEETPVDSVQRINPKISPEEQMDSLMNILKLNGNVNLNINDPGKNVKSVESDSSWLQPKVSPTNAWSY